MSQQRAKVGGEVGTNGEFYEGGKFLPSTEKAKGKPRKKGSGKQEIEPYKWEVPAVEGQRSIFRRIAGIFGRYIGGKLVIDTAPQTLNFYGETLESVTELAERFNRGERWY